MWPFNRHKHSWQVIRTDTLFDRLYGYQTQLTCRCRTCGKRDSWFKNGHWTVSDFEKKEKN